MRHFFQKTSCWLNTNTSHSQCYFSALRFDIVLMKDGRMKGQAFIGLPSERSAEKALRDTNGYILYDKPLVVVSFNPPHGKKDKIFSSKNGIQLIHSTCR